MLMARVTCTVRESEHDNRLIDPGVEEAKRRGAVTVVNRAKSELARHIQRNRVGEEE